MKIITNTAISLDGKISTRKSELIKLGSQVDTDRMSMIRAQADAVLVGGNSFRTWPQPLYPRAEHARHDLLKSPMLNVIVSRTMNFMLSETYLNDRHIRSLFLTTALNCDGLIPANANVEVLSCKHDITPIWIVELLEARGIKTLLIEAGGDVLAQFLELNLIDEMYVTLCPKIIGGDAAPSLVQGHGFADGKLPQLKLLNSDVVHDEIFLHYGVKS